jgi:acyl-CoA thioesterase
MGEPDVPSPETIAAAIRQDAFARVLGIELLLLEPGHSRMAMRLTPQMANFNGATHGGAICALADAAFAAASNSHGTVAVALSMTTHFLEAPRPDAQLIAEAKETRLGRRAGFYDITVMESGGRVVARCQGVVQRQDRPVAGVPPERGAP